MRFLLLTIHKEKRTNMGSNAWLFWALASAGFASLTAIFAKMGLQGIDSDFATFIRTLVILRRAGLVPDLHRQMAGRERVHRKKLDIPDSLRPRHRRILARLLQSPATGQRLASRPVDKFSLVLVALMAVVFLDERPSTQEWIGLGLVTAGGVDAGFETVRRNDFSDDLAS